MGTLRTPSRCLCRAVAGCRRSHSRQSPPLAQGKPTFGAVGIDWSSQQTWSWNASASMIADSLPRHLDGPTSEQSCVFSITHHVIAATGFQTFYSSYPLTPPPGVVVVVVAACFLLVAGCCWLLLAAVIVFGLWWLLWPLESLSLLLLLLLLLVVVVVKPLGSGEVRLVQSVFSSRAMANNVRA